MPIGKYVRIQTNDAHWSLKIQISNCMFKFKFGNVTFDIRFQLALSEVSTDVRSLLLHCHWTRWRPGICLPFSIHHTRICMWTTEMTTTFECLYDRHQLCISHHIGVNGSGIRLYNLFSFCFSRLSGGLLEKCWMLNFNILTCLSSIQQVTKLVLLALRCYTTALTYYDQSTSTYHLGWPR